MAAGFDEELYFCCHATCNHFFRIFLKPGFFEGLLLKFSCYRVPCELLTMAEPEPQKDVCTVTAEHYAKLPIKMFVSGPPPESRIYREGDGLVEIPDSKLMVVGTLILAVVVCCFRLTRTLSGFGL